MMTSMRKLKASRYLRAVSTMMRIASIVPHTLEEAYEVADCIERDDLNELKGELGDLLFQIVFYAQLAQEQQLFNFNDVVSSV